MRLIDADELKKHIRRCDDSATRATFDYVHEDDIDDMPTVCDIEQIRDEIAKLRDSEQHGKMVRLYGWESMKEKVLQIIDKYTKGE